MEEVEAVTPGVQTGDAVPLQAEDHLHVALMEDHQMEDHLPAVQIADHQTVGAVLREQEAADHLHPVRAEAITVDLIAHHQKEEAVHQAADVDVKKVARPKDKLSPDSDTRKIELRLYFSYSLNF